MANHKAYNGHKNWNHWNVSLWLLNDYGLYNLALDHIRGHKGNRDGAARGILGDLADSDMLKTPDGAPYSYTTIRAALRGLS